MRDKLLKSFKVFAPWLLQKKVFVLWCWNSHQCVASSNLIQNIRPCRVCCSSPVDGYSDYYNITPSGEEWIYEKWKLDIWIISSLSSSPPLAKNCKQAPSFIQGSSAAEDTCNQKRSNSNANGLCCKCSRGKCSLVVAYNHILGTRGYVVNSIEIKIATDHPCWMLIHFLTVELLLSCKLCSWVQNVIVYSMCKTDFAIEIYCHSVRIPRKHKSTIPSNEGYENQQNQFQPCLFIKIGILYRKNNNKNKHYVNNGWTGNGYGTWKRSRF